MALPETMKAFVNMREGEYLTCGVRDLPTPTIAGPKDIIIKMEACPINPSDMSRVAMVARIAEKDPAKLEVGAPGILKAKFPEGTASGKDGVPMINGAEGCGTVVAAGEDAEAQALMGKRVALISGASYTQYCKHTLGTNPNFAVLPDDTTPAEGASVFVNPLTVVGFLHTMEVNGHKAIVHTAAGSNVGRMLIKHCKEQNVPLVNIVRRDDVAANLKKELGAEYVVNSSKDTYKADLLAAIKATGATIGFDATGGGELAGDILNAMTEMLAESEPDAGWYGPSAFREVFRYGGLVPGATPVPQSLGVGNWAYGGWLMPHHYKKYAPEHMQKAIAIAASGLKGTFSTVYGQHLKLEDFASSPEQYLAALVAKSDEKFLVTPNGPFWVKDKFNVPI